ncbi:aminotransferase class I/II-fold pyridoxal phosphate-dependent enzyme [bacterium]|nr:aminotransferase class I/II-fold pyridoxal phosphate-dependent enzyme [bacterium]
MSNYRIYLSPPSTSREEEIALCRALKSNWITSVGEELDSFEEELSLQMGGKPVLCTSSGTAAIHLALLLAEVKAGEEVICSSLTFIGSANPILYCGAKPVFIDSEPKTWNIDPSLVEKVVKERSNTSSPIKAIIAVDLYGNPCDYDAIRRVSQQYNIALIEDAAEALGSTYRGEPLGAVGDLGILSFNGNKIITTSAGGALVLQNKEQKERAKYLSTQARNPAAYYHHTERGYNYRMSNILAALGRAQLRNIQARVEKRRKNYQRYQENLSEISDIQFPTELEEASSNRWLTTFFLKRTENSVSSLPTKIIEELSQERIEARHIWKPMHLQPLFSTARMYGGPISEEIFEHGICLPSGHELKDGEIDEICSIIRSTIQRYRSS